MLLLHDHNPTHGPPPPTPAHVAHVALCLIDYLGLLDHGVHLVVVLLQQRVLILLDRLVILLHLVQHVALASKGLGHDLIVGVQLPCASDSSVALLRGLTRTWVVVVCVCGGGCVVVGVVGGGCVEGVWRV